MNQKIKNSNIRLLNEAIEVLTKKNAVAYIVIGLDEKGNTHLFINPVLKHTEVKKIISVIYEGI